MSEVKTKELVSVNIFISDAERVDNKTKTKDGYDISISKYYPSRESPEEIEENKCLHSRIFPADNFEPFNNLWYVVRGYMRVDNGINVIASTEKREELSDLVYKKAIELSEEIRAIYLKRPDKYGVVKIINETERAKATQSA